VLALPAIIGGAPIKRGLATAAYLGVAVVVLLIGAGAVLFKADAPLEWIHFLPPVSPDEGRVRLSTPWGRPDVVLGVMPVLPPCRATPDKLA
jgi:hypothetical protein